MRMATRISSSGGSMATVRPASKRLGLWGWGAGMSQTPFNSPSVFNFYPPDFPLTGTPLVGPQFSIMTTNTTFARINFANDLVYWWYGKGE